MFASTRIETPQQLQVCLGPVVSALIRELAHGETILSEPTDLLLLRTCKPALQSVLLGDSPLRQSGDGVRIDVLEGLFDGAKLLPKLGDNSRLIDSSLRLANVALLQSVSLQVIQLAQQGNPAAVQAIDLYQRNFLGPNAEPLAYQTYKKMLVTALESTRDEYPRLLAEMLQART